MDCLFCNIVSGKIPSEKIYEDEHTFAFLDIKPINPGHVLVVPKNHAQDIWDISSEDFLAVMHTVWKLASVVKESLGADGVNLMMNNGMHAGQLIDHVHVHVIPRCTGDGFKHWTGTPYEKGQEKQVAKKIKAKL